MHMKKIARWLILTSLWLGTAVAHAGTVTYVYTDPQGTPLAEADASGNITARFDYAPYGTAVASMSPAPNGPGYTGHVNDPDTGLVYMQARYYDPGTGRFLSVDPVEPSAGNPFNFSRYAYANNNPVSNTDPTGQCPDKNPCFEATPYNFFRDNFFGSMIGHQFGDPIALIRSDNINPLTSEALDRGQLQDAKLGVLMLAIPVSKPEKVAADTVKEVMLSLSKHGEAAEHAAAAIAAGKPSILTINRAGASANRQAATGGIAKIAGKQLDEYPPAMFVEGGDGASVRAINPRDNMSAGACIGNACRGLSDGAQVHIKVGN
jgi:RHS repeat-associated protein